MGNVQTASRESTPFTSNLATVPRSRFLDVLPRPRQESQVDTHTRDAAPGRSPTSETPDETSKKLRREKPSENTVLHQSSGVTTPQSHALGILRGAGAEPEPPCNKGVGGIVGTARTRSEFKNRTEQCGRVSDTCRSRSALPCPDRPTGRRAGTRDLE